MNQQQCPMCARGDKPVGNTHLMYTGPDIICPNYTEQHHWCIGTIIVRTFPTKEAAERARDYETDSTGHITVWDHGQKFEVAPCEILVISDHDRDAVLLLSKSNPVDKETV